MAYRGLLALVVALLIASPVLPPDAVGMPAMCDAARCVTHHDSIPNFAGQPTIQSVRSGYWSEAQTWTPGRVPGPADVVFVSAGTAVTYDLADARVQVVGVQGVLAFRTDVATRLTVGTVLVLPQGRLQIGTPAQPVGASVVAELVIADQALDVANDGAGTYDPQQYGTGLLAIDGSVIVGGAPRTPFVRLATEPRAGDLVLQLAQPVSGWRVGDRLFLPDSKHHARETVAYVYEGEEMTLANVSPDGRSLTLTSPLQFTHPGAHNGDGVLEFLPHVGNLTRNVIVRSENPAGTRGHVLLTGHGEIDVRYAWFRDLGRTTIDPLDNTTIDAQGAVTHLGANQIGRYPIHVHHLIGPSLAPASGHQFTLFGNAVEDRAAVNRHKWAITIHNSHYGLIGQNVVYNAAGWGIGTEQGNESHNDFTGNLVARVRGEGDRTKDVAGHGFWFRGPNNQVRDNAAANLMGNQPEAAKGFQFFFNYLGQILVPQFAGADVDMGQGTSVNGNAMALLEFARNEVYGATEIGLAIWWLGTVDYTPLDVQESVVRDFRVWNHSLYGYYGYPANRLTFDGFVARGDRSVIANPYEFVMGMWFGDYMNKDVVIRNADIQNLRTGIVPPYFMLGQALIEDSYLRNAQNVTVVTVGAPGSAPYGPAMPPKETIIRNVRFDTVAAPTGGGSQYAIVMGYTTHHGSANLVQRDRVFVEAFDGVPGDDFQVFYNEQAPGFVIPQSSGNLAGSPEAGLTNARNWDRYGIAIAGEMATGVESRAGIYGLVQGGAPAPPAATPPAITTAPASQSVLAGQAATFTVTATGTGPLAYQWQRNGATIPGATSATYVTPVTTVADNGASFRGVVSNVAGTVISQAATLSVTAPAANRAPVVSAGPGQTVKLGGALILLGTVTDDGLPNPPARVTVSWRKRQGPGTVAFGSPSETTTTAAFSKAGSYVLELAASDGVLSGTATVTVSVTKK